MVSVGDLELVSGIGVNLLMLVLILHLFSVIKLVYFSLCLEFECVFVLSLIAKYLDYIISLGG